jgi:hypothetical protein
VDNSFDPSRLTGCGEKNECFYVVRPAGNIAGFGDLPTLLSFMTNCTLAEAQYALWMLQGFGGLRRSVDEIRAGLVTGDESKLKEKET